MFRTRGVFAVIVLILTIIASASVADAVDPVAKCEAGKLNAWAKRRSCEHKQQARARRGQVADLSACATKFSAMMTKAGVACRYIDNADGTVTDLNTGLMWQQTDDAGGITDKDNTYGLSDGVDFDAADSDGTVFSIFLAGLNNCVTVNSSTVTGGYAGHCDWRLPQVTELEATLLAPFPCGVNPCIDESVFGPINASLTYWSATTDAAVPEVGWGIVYNGGSTHFTTFRLANEPVRAVRNAL